MSQTDASDIEGVCARKKQGCRDGRRRLPLLDWSVTFMSLDPNIVMDLWIVAVAATTNIACALAGCYLVLRRMSLLGDAISHAVLPGLVAAFILSGSVGTGTGVGVT